MRHYRVLLSLLLLASVLLLLGRAWLFPPPEIPPEEVFIAPFDPEAITVDPRTGAEIVSNQVLVRFRDGLPRTTIEAVIAGLGCIIMGEIPALNIYQLKVPDDADPIDLVAQFEKSPYVQWAGVNHIVRPLSTPAEIASASKLNDPYFHKQWALHNTGQTGGRMDADIDAPEAWLIEKGHPNVTIAILDTGVNYRHEDLRDNLRMPRGLTWDWIDVDTSPMDEGGHGTEMTGVAVARMNDKGVTGVAPYATFLPVRVLGEGVMGTEWAIVVGTWRAYQYGNAKIFNMSFGALARLELVEFVIDRILRESDDVLFIASAGNDGIQGLLSPAGHEGVMAVAATDHNDQRSDWGRYVWRWWPPGQEWIESASNYDRWVDVSAPGGSSTYHIHPERWIRSTGLRRYGWTGGTSSATAFVSGVAALIWSLDYRPDGDFDLSGSDVWDIIVDSADNIDHLNPNYREKLGAGRVNAYKALRKAQIWLNQPPTVTIISPPDGSPFTQGQAIIFRGSATDPEDGTLTGAALVWASSIDGQIGTGESLTSSLSVGTHTITLTATDRQGAEGTDSITIIVAPPKLQLPRIIGSVDTPGRAYGVFISGNHAFVADRRSGLQIIDISNPNSPFIVGSVDTPGYAADVFISGNHAFVADGGGGLQIIDISDPGSPFRAGSVSTSYAWDVSISGNHAYVADDGVGLRIIDISNPGSPFIIGSVDTLDIAWDVFISGNHAFVADGWPGLQIIDISNPSSPVIVGSMNTPGRAMGVFISGDHAYVADNWQGLQIIDISNPSSPFIIGSIDTPAIAWDVFISGNYAFVADGVSGLQADEVSGLQIIDISNPASPFIVGGVDTPCHAIDVFISGNYAFVVTIGAGLQIIDISNFVGSQ